MTVRYTLLVLVVLIASGALIAHVYDVSPGERNGPGAAHAVARPHRPPPYGTAPARVRVTMRFKHAPRSGELFDLRTGRVLWSRELHRRQPIASLAKMMTAIVVNDRARDRDRVFISGRARQEPGSAIGLLPPHRHVRVRLLLYGLMLPSGNDAAIALAQHVGGGSVQRFVHQMNAKARALGLHCSHFSSPDGYEDRGNRSCPRDLAVLAREVLRRRRLARVVRTAYISFPSLLPHTAKVKRNGKRRKITVWKPGRLYLATHNPLLVHDYPGTTGVKTGYTDAAGRCLVATARRRGVSLGVVLLHSPDPRGQAERLLNRGFRAMWRARAVARRRAR